MLQADRTQKAEAWRGYGVHHFNQHIFSAYTSPSQKPYSPQTTATAPLTRQMDKHKPRRNATDAGVDEASKRKYEEERRRDKEAERKAEEATKKMGDMSFGDRR